ncbi:MAG: TonB-dependent receptor [Kiritimatiellae bacterium]|nr:TonB-dependent receptor [Kiritimatiellia bacterium]
MKSALETTTVPIALAIIALTLAAAGQTDRDAAASGRRMQPTFNPDISAILDVFYHDDDSAEGIRHVLRELPGFRAHHSRSHNGDHSHPETPRQGFNLRHVELVLSAAVDPYARGMVNVVVTRAGAELEEAWFETLSLPLGLKLKGGKFYSDFGYINPRHPHEWDFADQPLVYRLMLGEHGLNDTGLQLSWLAPTPWYLLVGAELFQGESEAFSHAGDAPLPPHDAPRLCVGWLKFGPPVPGPHGLQIGTFGILGRHQEEHDEDQDGEPDHWLDGEAIIWGADAVYKYDAARPYGEGDLTIQGEYARRDRSLGLVAHKLRPELIGRALETAQDGYYLQAVYGVLPRWRLGVRWEQAGLINRDELPDGSVDESDPSWKASAMLEFAPSEFSRFRAQVSRGRYELADGADTVTELYLQAIFSLGAHGAHKF